MNKRLIFAVGGTGGHLFPAQALARQLKKEDFDILFAGGQLGLNPFFKKLQFPFREISSASPFRISPMQASFRLFRGMREANLLFKEFSPDCIIGFGSYYSFPILATAWLKNIPYILVESNAHPGKVNRFFSKKAQINIVQFEEAASCLKGSALPGKVPLWASEDPTAYLASQEEAKKYFHLDPHGFTLLIFGGSQGAASLNLVGEYLKGDLQVLHFCGRNYDAHAVREIYKKQGICACVKPFEERMQIAWRAADMVLCRSGASTLNEIVTFQVPAILVPWPGASENHQVKNAQILEKKGGAFLLEEEKLHVLPQVLENMRQNIYAMRFSLLQEKEKKVEHLSDLVKNQLKGL